jgi:mono/diheme cytochrome c family protein
VRYVVALIIALVAPATMAAAADADEVWPTFGSPNAFTERGGEAIYRSVCAGCHMPEGRGASGAGTYPSLAGDPRLAASDYPIGVVLHGQRAMPPFAHSLTNEQVASVVTYIRIHFGNGFADAPTAADVAAQR